MSVDTFSMLQVLLFMGPLASSLAAQPILLLRRLKRIELLENQQTGEDGQAIELTHHIQHAWKVSPRAEMVQQSPMMPRGPIVRNG